MADFTINHYHPAVGDGESEFPTSFIDLDYGIPMTGKGGLGMAPVDKPRRIVGTPIDITLLMATISMCNPGRAPNNITERTKYTILMNQVKKGAAIPKRIVQGVELIWGDLDSWVEEETYEEEPLTTNGNGENPGGQSSANQEEKVDTIYNWTDEKGVETESWAPPLNKDIKDVTKTPR